MLKLDKAIKRYPKAIPNKEVTFTTRFAGNAKLVWLERKLKEKNTKRLRNGIHRFANLLMGMKHAQKKYMLMIVMMSLFMQHMLLVYLECYNN